MSTNDRRRHTRSSLDDLLRQLLALSATPASDEVLVADLDLVLEELHDVISSRWLDTAYEEVFVSAIPVGGREIDGTPLTFVMITGLNAGGDPEPLAYLSGYAAAPHLVVRAFWDLGRRGVDAVARVLGRANIGLDDICEVVFPGADWIELPPGQVPSWLEVPDP